MSGQERAEIVEERLQAKRIRNCVVLSPHQLGCKLVEQVVCFVCNSWAAHDCQSVTTMSIDYRIELLGHVTNSFVPRGRNQPAAFLIANERSADAFLMVHKRMAKAALDAEKLSIESINVAVAGHDPHQLAAARAQRHLTAVRTIGAGGNGLGQLPWARLMTIGSIEQSTSRATLDAVATL